MAVIIIIWGIWFFPRGKSDISGSAGYSKFKRDLIGAFTIFAPDEQQENKVNIDDLRARVFGDVIER